MKLLCCAIYDKVAQCYMQPFFVIQPGVAIRGFADGINSANDKSDIVKHPDDFDLYQLGAFDDSSGRLFVEEIPIFLAKGSSLKITNS